MASAAPEIHAATSDVLDAHERLLIDQAIAKHAGRPGALLGILETVQAANAHKFLSMPALRYIADETGVPSARVYSAATFYALFNLDPQGDNVICVCRGTACHTRGSRDLLDKLCLDLGLSEHEADENTEADKLALTTADRRFTVRTVACFGQCALAPVVEVNHHILSHVNERTLQREVKSLTHAARPRDAMMGAGMNLPQRFGDSAPARHTERAVSEEGGSDAAHPGYWRFQCRA